MKVTINNYEDLQKVLQHIINRIIKLEDDVRFISISRQMSGNEHLVNLGSAD